MGQKVQAPSVRAASSLGFFKPLGISGGAVQTPGKKGARHFLNTARGKERPAPTRSSEEEEDSEEDGVVTQVDLWGAEDSDADVIDDYGADSNSEDGEEEEGEEVRFTSLGVQAEIIAFQSFSRPLRLSLSDKAKPEQRKGILEFYHCFPVTCVLLVHVWV